MKTILHEKEDCDRYNCHLCPNVQEKPGGSGFECWVCGLSMNFHNDELTDGE